MEGAVPDQLPFPTLLSNPAPSLYLYPNLYFSAEGAANDSSAVRTFLHRTSRLQAQHHVHTVLRRILVIVVLLHTDERDNRRIVFQGIPARIAEKEETGIDGAEGERSGLNRVDTTRGDHDNLGRRAGGVDPGKEVGKASKAGLDTFRVTVNVCTLRTCEVVAVCKVGLQSAGWFTISIAGCAE